jgi:hypothetical protein
LTLCDRLEKNNSKHQDFLRKTIGGKICNQMIREPSGMDDDSDSNIRENEERFNCVSLSVKGFKSLNDSLVKFVESEHLSGIIILSYCYYYYYYMIIIIRLCMECEYSES